MRTTVALLALGLVLAVAGVLMLDGQVDPAKQMNAGRLSDMRAGLAVREDGGPLLLGRGAPVATPGHFQDNTGYYPLGIVDDPGLALWVPLGADAVGAHDAVHFYKWTSILLVAALLFVYPLLFAALHGSPWAGAAVGVAALAVFADLMTADVPWVSLWVVMAAVPVLLLLARQRPRGSIAILSAMMVVAGVATSVRGQAGLPALVGALMVLPLVLGTWRRRVLAGIVLVLVYGAFGAGIAHVIRDTNQPKVADPTLRDGLALSHPLWHDLILGLSFSGNDYGVKAYQDGYAIILVNRERPGTPIWSDRYEAVARRIYWRIVGDHPVFVGWGYTKRAVRVIGGALITPIMALLLPAAALVLLGERRRRWGRQLLFVAPALVVTFIVAVFIHQTYAMPFDGTVRLAGMLALGELVAARALRRGQRVA